MAETTVNERPILMSGEMVRAILDGRKTQTRRVVKLRQFQRSETPGYDWTFRGTRRGAPTKGTWQDFRHEQLLDICPYGKPGDRLWVRETFAIECNRGHDYDEPDKPVFGPIRWNESDDQGRWFECPRYRASEPDVCLVIADVDDMEDAMRWTPSIHMPRWASRITLEVTGVRVERPAEISEEDAIAEGVCSEMGAMAYRNGSTKPGCHTPRDEFERLWDSINGKTHPWESSPWVWVVSFRKLETANP